MSADERLLTDEQVAEIRAGWFGNISDIAALLADRDARQQRVDAVAAAVLAYGQALRGDWSEFDGRGALHCLTDLIKPLTDPTARADFDWLLADSGVCVKGAGRGHWTCHCSDRHPDSPESGVEEFCARKADQ